MFAVAEIRLTKYFNLLLIDHSITSVIISWLHTLCPGEDDRASRTLAITCWPCERCNDEVQDQKSVHHQIRRVLVSVRALNHASADGAQGCCLLASGIIANKIRHGTPTPDAVACGITDRAAKAGPRVRILGGTLVA